MSTPFTLMNPWKGPEGTWTEAERAWTPSVGASVLVVYSDLQWHVGVIEVIRGTVRRTIKVATKDRQIIFNAEGVENLPTMHIRGIGDDRQYARLEPATDLRLSNLKEKNEQYQLRKKLLSELKAVNWESLVRRSPSKAAKILEIISQD